MPTKASTIETSVGSVILFLVFIIILITTDNPNNQNYQSSAPFTLLDSLRYQFNWKVMNDIRSGKNVNCMKVKLRNKHLRKENWVEDSGWIQLLVLFIWLSYIGGHFDVTYDARTR